ncbi:MAG: hypothetical protein K6E90_05370 [Lachnospiraceae bacterium]|nr:hypothetical protein [Lachnospiraceae bacterium]
MSRRYRERESSLGKWVAIVIMLIFIMLILMAYLILSGNGNSNPVTQSIQREVTKKAVDKVVTEQSGGSTSLQEIESQMSDDDAETFNDIVDKYSDSGLVSEAISVYSANGGDLGATADELRDKVDPEDIETLKELYSKYGE